MTDTTVFYKTVVTKTTAFIAAYEDMLLLADRIAADSGLATAAAAAASAGGRTDLTAAKFDNLNSAMGVVATLLNNPNGSVNTGGTVKLAFYQIM